MKLTPAAVREDFETYGIQIEDNAAAEKCVALCIESCLSAEQLAVTWLSYSASKGIDELTVDTLEQLQKDELASSSKVSITKVEQSEGANTSGIYSLGEAGYEDEILAAYGASPVVRKVERTPRANKRRLNTKEDLSTTLQNQALSPSCSSPSQRYSSRSNAGKIISSYGPNVDSISWKANFPSDVQVSHCGCGGDNALTTAYRYMYEMLRESAEILSDTIYYLSDQMKNKLEIEEWSPLDIPSNESAWFVGRICCDGIGKLNPASVLLEGSVEQLGNTVHLNLSNLPSFSLFPGQVVAVKGINGNGQCIIVEKIVNGVSLLPPPSFPSSLDDKGLHIKVASGPFTTMDNLLFEPLTDFLKMLSEDPPHVLILLGPLLDASHPLLLQANETCDTIVSKCLNEIYSVVEKTETTVLLVSSSRDVSCPMVYPTPPIHQNNSSTNDEIIFLPDPSIVNINGVSIGLSATDVLMQISKEEISFPPQTGDRLARLAEQLFSQQSFYPLYPATEGICINREQADIHSKLPFKPHMMILPSDLKGFIKNVSDCHVVNPERLTRGTVGGSYAKLHIQQTDEKNIEINGQILKI